MVAQNKTSNNAVEIPVGGLGISALPAIFLAVVIETKDNNLTIIKTAQGEQLEVQTADGCLLKPNVQDKVLVAQDDGGKLYIFTVVIRADNSSLATISVDGGMHIKSPNVVVSSEKSLDLIANSINQESVNSTQTAINSSISVDTMNCHINKTNFVSDKVSSVVSWMSTKVTTAFQRFNIVHREVTSIENNKAKNRTDSIESHLQINAHNAKIQTKSGLHLYSKQTFMN